MTMVGEYVTETIPGGFSVDTNEVSSVFDIIGSCYSIIHGITIFSIPIDYWVIGVAALGIVVAFIKGDKS